MVRTAVLVSGGGTNLQALLDAHARGEVKNCHIAAVISSSPDAYALTRAENAGVKSHVVDKSLYPGRSDYSRAVLEKLKELRIELVVLAGFMFVLEDFAVNEFRDRMINIHPSLIPAFCGEGYYGLKVHEAALSHGVKLSGATAHFVTAETDMGPIIVQRAVKVLEDDTPRTLQRRIMEEAEWRILPQAVSLCCEGRIRVDGRIVRISD